MEGSRKGRWVGECDERMDDGGYSRKVEVRY